MATLNWSGSQDNMRELGVERLKNIRIGRRRLNDLPRAETALWSHKSPEARVDGISDVNDELAC